MTEPVLITITRKKGGAVSYATAVHPGFSLSWASEAEKAKQFDDETAKKIAEAYSKRSGAGLLQFTDAASGKVLAEVGVEGDPPKPLSQPPTLASMIDRFNDLQARVELVEERLEMIEQAETNPVA